MSYDPFVFTDSVNLQIFTPGQIHRAKIRMARDFGLRGLYTPFVYIVLLVCLTLLSKIGMDYFKQIWPLELLLVVVSLLRFYTASALSKVIPEKIKLFQRLYLYLSLMTALLWGLMSACFIANYGLQAYGYIVLTVCVAITAGAIGSMTQYHRVWNLFIGLLWLPVLSALFYQGIIKGNAGALLLFVMAPLMLVFLLLQGKKLVKEYQNGQLQRLQLEVKSEDLRQALLIIKQQQQEVIKHRDHLQELVDEQTASLIQARDKAEQADRSKSEFLANMSHELRTPLHAILSFSSFGMKRIEAAGKEKIYDYFEKINRSGALQLSLVNDLLDLSRLEANKVELALSRFNLIVAINHVINELSSLFEEKGISIDSPADDENVCVHADQEKIQQVIRNLLSNGIKFSPQNSQILIRISHDGDNVRMEFEDQGPGVAAEEKGLIFDKFNQSSRTRTGAGGSGLGLAICYQLIQLHHGDIWVEDAIPQGALFIVLLPSA